MNTSQYRDEIDSLRDAVSSFSSCVSFDEREKAVASIGRLWTRLSLLEQPKRLPQAVAERCDRIRKQAADLMNNWKVEVDSGCAQESKPMQPNAKAMADTMRFCNAMKSRGM